jgi:hypothetical protein
MRKLGELAESVALDGCEMEDRAKGNDQLYLGLRRIVPIKNNTSMEAPINLGTQGPLLVSQKETNNKRSNRAT